MEHDLICLLIFSEYEDYVKSQGKYSNILTCGPVENVFVDYLCEGYEVDSVFVDGDVPNCKDADYWLSLEGVYAIVYKYKNLVNVDWDGELAKFVEQEWRKQIESNPSKWEKTDGGVFWTCDGAYNK